MRLAATSMVTISMLVFTGCTATGTPSPSAVTVTPVFLPPTATSPSASPGASASGAGTPSPGPQHRSPGVQLSERRIGTAPLGSASPDEVRKLLTEPLGKGKENRSEACVGRATAVSWGGLTVTFAGLPQVAQHWQVDTEKGTRGLQLLPRGTEWRPDRAALAERDDVAVSTHGRTTTFTLPGGFSYVFPDGEQRARFVSAGTLDCG